MADRRLRTLVKRAATAVKSRLPEPADAELLAAAAAYLPAGEARIAVLTDRTDGSLAARLRRLHPHAKVTEATGAGSASHVRLTAQGPFDVIIDALGPERRPQRFLDTFYQLRDGGAMVIRDGAGEARWAEQGTLGAVLTAAVATKGEPYPSNKRGIPRAALDAHGLGTALGATTVTGAHLVLLRSGPPTLAKLREPETNAYLAARPQDRDRVLELIPAQPFTSRCEFRENSEERRPGFPERYETIDIALRLYHDVLASPAQVLTTDRVVLADTYRHNQFSRLRNRALQEVAPRFARLPHTSDDVPYLAGTYFHLDSEMRGHFGHLMTEQLSRMWAWEKAQSLYPGIKAVVAINKGRELRGWETQIYAAGGIPAEDVVFLEGPARVERMVSATPMLSNPDYVHPAIVPTWRRVGDNLAASAEAREFPKRFFCSRRLSKRSCHNTDEVEALFAANGFEIIYPEDYSLGEQVHLFRGAEVIGGFVGSALFTLCYVMDPKRVILVGSTAYTARNEYLIAALLGHRIDSVACVPDDPTFYQSAFRFDPEREGEFLASVFASL